MAELQPQVDEFDRIYNTERPHQGLPGRVTPLTAWQATPKADRPAPNLTGRSTRRRPQADTGSRELSRPPICPRARVSER
ncbi:transposase [Mycolicibacterium baixiangningiae]|uniref:transposase n=1 Tax=Mycolicibacterium baixiangningiae TaxID=2761578 RepID=UPI001D028D47|nr:transposase [Mycolicibacterium baixiangningiae]